MKKLNNSGFSLIEVIVVIAIIAIMTVGATAGFGFLDLASSSKCAAKIDTGLSKLKSKNMSMTSSMYMHLYSYDDEYYVLFNGSSAFSPNGSNYTDGERIGNEKLKIYFDDQDLAVRSCVSIGVRRKDGAFTNTLTPTSTIKIVREADNSTAHTVTLVTATGKHFID